MKLGTQPYLFSAALGLTALSCGRNTERKPDPSPSEPVLTVSPSNQFRLMVVDEPAEPLPEGFKPRKNIESELEALFKGAYRFDPSQKVLVEVDAVQSNQLKSREAELVGLSFQNERAAREYASPGIIKYHYLASDSLDAGQRAILWQLDQKRISVQSVVEGINTLPVDDSTMETWLALASAVIVMTPERDLSFFVERPDTPFGQFVGMKAFSIKECLAKNPEDQDICTREAELGLVIYTEDEFDNALIRHVETREMWEKLHRYIAASLSDKLALQEKIVSDGLISGKLGPVLTRESIVRMIAQVEGETGHSHIPPAWISPSGQAHPITLEELSKVGPGESIQIRVQDMPLEWKTLAQYTKLSFVEGDLWSFLEKNVDCLILTRAGIKKTTGEEGAAGRSQSSVKTIIVSLDRKGNARPDFDVLSVIAHEAYHNYFFFEEVPRNPRLAMMRLIDERNAHILQAEVLEKLFVLRRRNGAQRSELETIATRVMDKQSVYMGANLALGYSVDDRSSHADLNVDPRKNPILGSYPTVFMQLLAPAGYDFPALKDRVWKQLDFE